MQATCAGLAIGFGGVVRDVVSALAERGLLGHALTNPATGYSFVYHVELYLMFATLIALGPLVRRSGPVSATPQRQPEPSMHGAGARPLEGTT